MRKFIPTFSISLLVLSLSIFIFLIGNITEKVSANASEIDSLKEEIVHKENILKGQQEKLDKQTEDIGNLIKQNDILKKKIETYKDSGESPSVSSLPSRGDSPKARAITFEATAYTAMCNTGCIGITATGYNVKNTTTYDGMRVIATDPKVIPMYSIVKVETKDETFHAIALDTGGAIKGHKIDVLVSNKKKAWNFGRQAVAITILRSGKGK